MTNPNITKYNILKGFISTFLSGISFVLLFFLLQLSVIISVFIGVIVFFIVYNFAPTTKNHHHQSGGSSEKHQNIHEKLKIGQEKLRVIEDNSTKINDTKIRQKIRNICQTGNKILEGIEANPDDFNAAKQFFSYYLDATNTIVTKYSELQQNREFISNADNTFEKTEKIFDTIELAFQKQLEKLFEDDVMNLDIELNVLKRTLKMEGI